MEISVVGGGGRVSFFEIRTGLCSSNFPVDAPPPFLSEALLSDHTNGACLMYLLLPYVHILRINIRIK